MWLNDTDIIHTKLIATFVMKKKVKFEFSDDEPEPPKKISIEYQEDSFINDDTP